MINITNLQKEYHGEIVFKDVSFTIQKGSKTALLGQNGTGKSTLIKCILGLEPYDGDISNSFECSVMMQEKEFPEGGTFKEYLSAKKQAFEELIAKVDAKLANPALYEDQKALDAVITEHTELSKQKITFNEQKCIAILQRFGFKEDLFDAPISKLSGGEITALRLADSLSKKADCYILDEPTNHIDFTIIKLVEEFVIESDAAYIIVSHDRAFIQAVTKTILHLENQQMRKYDMDYEHFCDAKEEYYAQLREANKRTTQKRQQLLVSSEEKRKWAHKNGNKSMRMAADNIERRANAIDQIDTPESFLQDYKYSFLPNILHSMQILTAENLSKTFERQIFSNVSFTIQNRERVCIIGPNGCGKSTMLKILAGLLDSDTGSVKSAEKIKIGYFDQEGKTLPQNMKIKTFFEEILPHVEPYSLAIHAEKFGFGADFSKKKINTLSGGEKVRLQLLKLSLEDNNVLLLDEPTNHLDLELRSALESALQKFEGTVVFISHDRYFITKVATRILSFNGMSMKK
jgi:ATP-binding cassette subfamily F protein 3